MWTHLKEHRKEEAFKIHNESKDSLNVNHASEHQDSSNIPLNQDADNSKCKSDVAGVAGVVDTKIIPNEKAAENNTCSNTDTTTRTRTRSPDMVYEDILAEMKKDVKTEGVVDDVSPTSLNNFDKADNDPITIQQIGSAIDFVATDEATTVEADGKAAGCDQQREQACSNDSSSNTFPFDNLIADDIDTAIRLPENASKNRSNNFEIQLQNTNRDDNYNESNNESNNESKNESNNDTNNDTNNESNNESNNDNDIVHHNINIDIDNNMESSIVGANSASTSDKEEEEFQIIMEVEQQEGITHNNDNDEGKTDVHVNPPQTHEVHEETDKRIEDVNIQKLDETKNTEVTNHQKKRNGISKEHTEEDNDGSDEVGGDEADGKSQSDETISTSPSLMNSNNTFPTAYPITSSSASSSVEPMVEAACTLLAQAPSERNGLCSNPDEQQQIEHHQQQIAIQIPSTNVISISLEEQDCKFNSSDRRRDNYLNVEFQNVQQHDNFVDHNKTSTNHHNTTENTVRNNHTDDNESIIIIGNGLLNTNDLLDDTNDNDISYDESVSSVALANLKQHYDSLLSNQKLQHNQQIDEILEQLTSIESTYHAEITTLKSNLSRKEVMCDAITASLSDYKQRTQEFEVDLDQTSRTMYDLQCKLETITMQLQDSKRENIALRKSSQQAKEEAVSYAQQEVQSQAESQFAAAQKKYLQLKADHQHNLKEKEILQEQLNVFTQQMENKDRVHKSHISQVQEELNVVRLELSSSKVENQKVKSMLNERMSQLEQNEQLLEEQLSTKVKEYQTLIREKHDLKGENTELQSVCEELMAIVERGVGTSGSVVGGPSTISIAEDGAVTSVDYSSPSVTSRSSRSSNSTSRGF